VDELIKRVSSLHDKLARSHPKLERGMVWCHRCGRTEHVSGADCLRSGGPLCCRQTMSIDSPAERAALRARTTTGGVE
jgi:hypothetical protein